MNWSSGYLIDNLHLLWSGTSHMFTEDATFSVHLSSEPCGLSLPEQEESNPDLVEDKPLDLLTEDLSSFPWGKRGLRLLSYLRAKKILDERSDTLENIPIIDILRAVSTPTPPSVTGANQSTQSQHIKRILRKLKLKQKLRIPASYIGNKEIRKIFWGEGA